MMSDGAGRDTAATTVMKERIILWRVNSTIYTSCPQTIYKPLGPLFVDLGRRSLPVGRPFTQFWSLNFLVLLSAVLFWDAPFPDEQQQQLWVYQNPKWVPSAPVPTCDRTDLGG
ncbi:hypothetical protein Ddc_06744 [Ditylenchus destructor]|nr:hypothetical protein Ddc_06744 [Ditylenchus destructor]